MTEKFMKLLKELESVGLAEIKSDGTFKLLPIPKGAIFREPIITQEQREEMEIKMAYAHLSYITDQAIMIMPGS